MKYLYIVNTLLLGLSIGSFSQVYAKETLNLKSLLIRNQLDENISQKTILKTDEVMAQKDLSKANLLPQLSANFKKEYAKSLVPSQDRTTPQEFSLVFSTAIFDGKNYFQYKKNKLQTESRYFEEEVEAQKLLKDLAFAFIEYYESKKILEITENSIKVLENYEKATLDRLNIGDSTTLELEKVRSRLYSTQADLITAQIDYRNKKDSFYVLWNIELNSNDNLDLLTRTELDELGNLNLVPLQQDVQSAEKKYEAANQLVTSAKMANLPNLNLIASYTNASPDNFQYNNDETSYKIGLQINIPIFSGGETWANTRIAVSQREQSLRDLTILKKNKIQETTRLKNDFKLSLDSLEMQLKAVASNSNVFKFLNKDMKGSVRTTFDVLNAMDDLYKSEISYTKAYSYANKRLVDYLYGYGHLNYDYLKSVLK